MHQMYKLEGAPSHTSLSIQIQFTIIKNIQKIHSHIIDTTRATYLPACLPRYSWVWSRY
jgi:hypothetical protein